MPFLFLPSPISYIQEQISYNLLPYFLFISERLHIFALFHADDAPLVHWMGGMTCT